MSKLKPQLAKTTLRISATYQSQERQRTFYKPSLLLGRCGDGTEQPDLDLSDDNTISRSHARIWIEDGKCWIEDLGSKFGTKVDAADVRGRGKVIVDAASRIQLGNTALKVEGPFESASGFVELSPQPSGGSTIEINKTVAGSPGHLIPPNSGTLESIEKRALLLEILVQFSLPAPLDQLLQTIIGRVVELISGAERAALLLCNPATDGFLLAAFVSDGEPAVSETLARRALKQNEAFVWCNRYGADHSMSIHKHQILSGMYAPLIYDGWPLGVICLDNPNCHSAFSEEDLQLLVAVADHAAVAVSHRQLRQELIEKSKLLESLLAEFPQDVRDQMIDRAHSVVNASGPTSDRKSSYFSPRSGHLNVRLGT